MNIFDIDIPYIYVGIQTKEIFACPVYGPNIKSRHSKILRKEVFDEYRHFLSKNHMYRENERNIFNGNQETPLKPRRITPHLWKMQYNRNCQADMYGSVDVFVTSECIHFYILYIVFH